MKPSKLVKRFLKKRIQFFQNLVPRHLLVQAETLKRRHLTKPNSVHHLQQLQNFDIDGASIRHTVLCCYMYLFIFCLAF